MKISHAEIEQCRNNPHRWVAQKIRPSAGFRIGYDRATILAIYRYHVSGDTAEAHDFLIRLLDKLNLRNAHFVKAASTKLNSYVAWCRGAVLAVSECHLRLNYELGYGWVLGGEISRIDLDLESEGYRGILLGNRPVVWKQQFRFPLIQRSLSARLQRAEAQISVGFQSIDGSQLDTVTFPQQRLDEADAEAQRLAKILSSEWSYQKGHP